MACEPLVLMSYVQGKRKMEGPCQLFMSLFPLLPPEYVINFYLVLTDLD